MNQNYIKSWTQNIKGDMLGGIVTTFSVIPEVIGFTIVAGVSPMLGLYTSIAFLILSSILGGRPAMVSAGAGSMALVVVKLIADYGTEYLFAAVLLAGLFQLVMGICKIGNLIKYIPTSVMTGFVDALAITIFISQIKNCAGGNLKMVIFIILAIAIVYLFPFVSKAIPSTLVAIIAVTLISVLSGGGTTTIGELGSMSASLPDLHIPTLLLEAETWKIVLPYSISLAFVGLIETLLTERVIDNMTGTKSNQNQECRSQGFINMICGLIGGMPGCAMIGQAIVNVNSGSRGRFSTCFSGILLALILAIGSPLLNVIPLAALVGVMITVSIATFNWDELRAIRRSSILDVLTTIATVVVVIATDNLAYGVGTGLVIYYAGIFLSKLKM